VKTNLLPSLFPLVRSDVLFYFLEKVIMPELRNKDGPFESSFITIETQIKQSLEEKKNSN